MNENSKSIGIVSRWTDNFSYSVEVPAGTVPAMLSNAWAKTNRDDRPLGNKVCSTSIGDLLIVDGRHFIVEPFGFTEVSAADAEAWKLVPERDAHFGFTDAVESGVFSGKALSRVE